MPAAPRVRADACPGVVATHDAADGTLARVRLPGGVLAAEQARAVAGCAQDLADGAIHLTSRANLQLRAVRDTDALVARLSAAGLLPAPSHERVRNILGSPLSGLRGGVVDVRPFVAALDVAVCARPELAELPGRFLFAFDDGRGDVAGEDADVCWQAVGRATDTTDTTGTEGTVLLDGRDSGLRVRAGEAVAALVEAAVAFGRTRGAAWRLREADHEPVLAAVRPFAHRRVAPAELPRGGPVRVGRTDGADGAVVAAPVFGRLDAAVLHALAGHGPLVVTPWRTLVVPGSALREPVLRDALVVEPDAPSLGVSACIGSPGCAKSRADVRADARAIMAPGVFAHVSGCERRCGRPRGAHTDVLAVDGGYRVDGVLVPSSELGDTVRKPRGSQ